jgi:hypothetical protein
LILQHEHLRNQLGNCPDVDHRELSSRRRRSQQ